MINGLYSSDHEQVVEFERPVKAVAIAPQYSKQSKQFVSGDDKVVFVSSLTLRVGLGGA